MFANCDCSQGAAVNHRAIEDLSQAVKNQIAAVVTFGDTQARADNQQIPNFPKDKLKIDVDLIRHSTEQRCETYVKVGWRVGIER